MYCLVAIMVLKKNLNMKFKFITMKIRFVMVENKNGVSGGRMGGRTTRSNSGDKKFKKKKIRRSSENGIKNGFATKQKMIVDVFFFFQLILLQ